MAAGMGQGRSSAMFMLVGTVAVLLLLSCTGARAATYVVGDDQHWKIPASGDFYTKTWAAQYTFKVGDVLQFVYSNVSHNVQPMPVDSCNKTLATKANVTDGLTNIKLKTPGTKFYICSVASHCDKGMKLQITVLESGSPTIAAPTPGPNSAAAPRFAGVIDFGTVTAAATVLLSMASFFL